MQIIYKNKVEGKHGRKTNTVGVVTCTGGVSRCMERKCNE